MGYQQLYIAATSITFRAHGGRKSIARSLRGGPDDLQRTLSPFSLMRARLGILFLPIRRREVISSCSRPEQWCCSSLAHKTRDLLRRSCEDKRRCAKKSIPK